MLSSTRTEGTDSKNAFQRHQVQSSNVFDVIYDTPLERYLAILGINPYHQGAGNTCKRIIVTFTFIICMIPMCLQLYTAIIKKDLDEAIEEVPPLCVLGVCLTKYLNIVINRNQFKTLFDSIVEDWHTFRKELTVLDKATKQGYILAHLYQSVLLTFLVIFLFVPLIPVVLDIIVPLNETRTRQQILKANYLVDPDDYFFSIYCHLSWTSIISVLTVVTVDSVYVHLIHHNSGLFDVCGYQLKTATANDIADPDVAVTKQNISKTFKQYMTTHHKALRFYGAVEECSGTMNLIQIGFSMMSISITAVQTVLYMGYPSQLLRFALFLIAQKIHLFVMSFIGQVLLNHATRLRVTLYSSNWYTTPIELQKLIHMMQIRCSKPCILTAGGLYNMNIENFGVLLKACISYFTMFLSLRE